MNGRVNEAHEDTHSGFATNDETYKSLHNSFIITSNPPVPFVISPSSSPSTQPVQTKERPTPHNDEIKNQGYEDPKHGSYIVHDTLSLIGKENDNRIQ